MEKRRERKNVQEKDERIDDCTQKKKISKNGVEDMGIKIRQEGKADKGWDR